MRFNLSNTIRSKRRADLELNVILFWDTCAYVVLGLEYNVCAQGDDPFGALASWIRVFSHDIKWREEREGRGGKLVPVEPFSDALLKWHSWRGQADVVHEEIVAGHQIRFWVERWER